MDRTQTLYYPITEVFGLGDTPVPSSMEGPSLQVELLWVPFLGLSSPTCIPSTELGTKEAQGAFDDDLWTQSLVTESTLWWLCLAGTLWELIIEYGLLLVWTPRPQCSHMAFTVSRLHPAAPLLCPQRVLFRRML